MYWHTEQDDEILRRITTWTKWFAWYPVYCNDENGKYKVSAWFTTVYRKYYISHGYDESMFKPMYMTVEDYEAQEAREAKAGR
jgi:hypothetical protein